VSPLLPIQKRGLNATGKASTKQIKTAVKNQVAKVQAKKPAVKTVALKKAAQPRPSGLRISFKPADLGKTTDKNMAAQVCSQTVYANMDDSEGLLITFVACVRL
jgi:hypothetical protein